MLLEADLDLSRAMASSGRLRYLQQSAGRSDAEGVEMVQRTPDSSISLYEADETAWLEQTADLVRTRQFDQIDAMNLAEYLSDMARRDRREVTSRLVVLLAHLLKWDYQRDRRSNSWLLTILEQQRELEQDFQGASLRNHALQVLDDAYQKARKSAAAETGLPRAKFPEQCPWDLDAALTDRGEDA